MWTRFSDLDRTYAMLDELRRRMDQAPESEWAGREWGTEDTFARTGFPRVNLHDSGGALVLAAEVPGLDEKDVKLSVYQDVLSLQGERKSEAPEGYAVHRQERPAARFSRSFTLPCKVDPEKTVASLKDGILTVTLPKAPEAQPRQIAVRTQG